MRIELTMRKSRLGLTVLITLSSFIAGYDAAFAQDSACYMVTSTGKRLDLSYMCKKNPPAPPATRVQTKKLTPTSSLRSISSPPSISSPRYYPSYSASVNLQAFLRVIRYAEGTDSDDGYQIQYTGARFNSFNDHPRSRYCGNIHNSRVCSSAAGAYQFLETTWDDVAYSIGASDFSPSWQDQGAIELIRRAGALGDIEAGQVETAISKLAPVWASFPRWSGDYQGEYAQSVVPMEYLVQEFRRQQQLQSYHQARK